MTLGEKGGEDDNGVENGWNMQRALIGAGIGSKVGSSIGHQIGGEYIFNPEGAADFNKKSHRVGYLLLHIQVLMRGPQIL